MIYVVSDFSTKFFTPVRYLALIVASVDKEVIINNMGHSDQPMVCAISDPETVKLINEDIGSTFEPSNVEAKLGNEMENSWIIAQVTDGKIQWFNIWVE